MMMMHRWVRGKEHWDEEGCRVSDVVDDDVAAVVDDAAVDAVDDLLMRRSRCWT